MPRGVYLHKPLTEEHKKQISLTHKAISHSGQFKIGHVSWNKGGIVSEDVRLKISNTNKLKGIKPVLHFTAKGKSHPRWTGDNVCYSGLHHWIKRELGKPIKCMFCNETEGKFEWANKSREYKRTLDDWISLCYKCHDEYDNVHVKAWITRKLNLI